MNILRKRLEELELEVIPDLVAQLKDSQTRETRVALESILQGAKEEQQEIKDSLRELGNKI